MRDQNQHATDDAFVVTVKLYDRTGDGFEDPPQLTAAREWTLVTEYQPDVEGIQRYALQVGWGVDVVVMRTKIVGGDGGAEIAQWITNADHAETANDPHAARMNKIERDVSSLGKNMRASFAELKAMITDAVAAGGSVRRVTDPELQRAAYVEGARLTPPIAEALAAPDEPRPTNRRDVPMRTPEMQGDPDFRSNSMAVVGTSAGSKIFSYTAGSDGDGLPKPAPMSRVGRSLYDGTKIDGADDDNGMKPVRRG